MHPILRVTWHFGGLVSLTVGSAYLWGWPAILVVLGTWAILGTALDALVEG